MNRRHLLRTVGGGAATGVSGCIGAENDGQLQETETTAATDSPTSSPTEQAEKPAETFTLGTQTVEGRELWSADFSSESGFRVEAQDGGGTFDFSGDQLHIDTTEERVGATVWREETFPEDVIVQYRASFEEDERRTGRNLNCFFAGSASEDSDTLEDTVLDGGYGAYHEIPNYTFTLTVGWARLRRNPGFNLEDEFLLGIGDFQDHFYEVTLLKRGDTVTTAVDGRMIHQWQDPDPLGAGWVGLRTHDSEITYDHWTVYEPL